MSHLLVKMSYTNDITGSTTHHITVLGSATINDQAITRRQRAMISALALYSRRGATADALVDATWGANAPASARASIQNQVARLRGAFGADLIFTRDDRYHVAATADATRFETLVTPWLHQPPTGRAIDLIEAALEMWCGVPYEDIGDHIPATVERARLEHIRGLAIESHSIALILLGHSSRVVADLSQRTVAAPFHERAWELLMISLYESTRRAEALQNYERFADLLSTELSAEPSTSLKRLRQTISLDQPFDVRELLGVPQPGPPRPVLTLATA